MTSDAAPSAPSGPLPAEAAAPPERGGRLLPLRVSAKTDYALRAVVELASKDGQGLVKAEVISQAQAIPLRFLLNILNELRHARIVRSHRGAVGGYQLARSAHEITVADIVMAIEGTLTTVHGAYPDELTYEGPAVALAEIYRAVDRMLRGLLGSVTVAEVVAGRLPSSMERPVHPAPRLPSADRRARGGPTSWPGQPFC
jgi:Rrf2 family protein